MALSARKRRLVNSIAAVRKNLSNSIPTIVSRLAHRVYGPGYNAGTMQTGDGTAKSYSLTTQNDSGAAILIASIVIQGWLLTTAGTTDADAQNISATIEYPVGTVVGTISSFAVGAGLNAESADVVLSAAIPAGGTFKVDLAGTPANTSKYPPNMGFAGLRTRALSSDLKKIALAWFGDSISTNNGGTFYNAALGKCPVYLNSIIGTLAQTYGASAAANFLKQVDVAAKLGCTHVGSNFGTNDLASAVTLSNLQSYLIAMRDRVRAAGMKYVQATMLPRTQALSAVTASAVTSSGTVMSVTVPNATLFSVGKPYVIAGATQTEYNGSWICLTANTTTNVVTLLFVGSATPTATGTITINQWKFTYEAAWMTDFSSQFAAGNASTRGQFNDWVRSNILDDYIEWADAVESGRDTNKWLTGGVSPVIPAIQYVTVASVVSTSRFTSDYNRGNGTLANGRVYADTGANAGRTNAGSGNTGGDITVSAAWPNTQVVGDKYYVVPGCSYVSDDGTHPRVATGSFGGQVLLDNVTSAWINARA